MTLAFIIYLVMTAFPALSSAGNFALFVTLATWMAGGFIYLASMGEREHGSIRDALKNHLRPLTFKLFLPIIVVGHLVPSSETAWWMVGGYAAQSLYQADATQQVLSESTELLEALVKRAKKETLKAVEGSSE
ncbi:hypothetical protein [Pseudomonas phage PaGz-1]|uniref:Uncharacterized protein n=1 Tax=Pseudomonas phage PaGz-1 TaxID=2419748 RepID=A0A411B980_9CAUD|nr:hypothetical protein QE322_gp101 [Pseudomonas phage PaGz-1]QAX98162.1 hypothetical protein [Pseudomonas phage PaGz-1]